MTTPSADVPRPDTLGHPNGLFMLFFAEMWERFSYYGMRALLVLYMVKGFLSYNDGQASIVYGAYTALVYMTPFFGGLLADRLLGPRRAVILGGLLMAGGHLVMTLEYDLPFFTALALLIIGNGFFKPNISTMVGGLYGDADNRRDAGFTLFYMGINLGAAMAPLLCGYIGETWGWHYGFGLATLGMLVGLALFVLPAGAARFLVLGGAVVSAVGMVAIPDNWLLLVVNGFVALALVSAAVIAFVAMGRSGLPAGTGDAPDPELLRAPVLGPLSREHLVYIGSVVIIPVVAALVWANAQVTIVPAPVLEALAASPSTLVQLGGTLLGEIARPAGLLLTLIGAGALVYLLVEAFRADRVERGRLFVVLILMVFSMLFWAFFEQAGTSVNLFTDRNVDRVFEDRVVQVDDVGESVSLTLTQEQLGYPAADGRIFTIDQLDEARDAEATQVTWTLTEAHVGMGLGGTEVPTSTFQSANPIYILLFGLVFSWLWTTLGRMRLEPPTPVKFSLGLAQLGLGFGALWWGAQTADPMGMVGLGWLLLAYLLHTTGELCISPVGLSMVTRLSPARLVSTVMGGWFLALAFSNYLAAVIASLTGVGGHGGGEEDRIPPPIETLDVYGDVFGTIGLAALISAVVVLALTPLLQAWTREDELPGSVKAEAGNG